MQRYLVTPTRASDTDLLNEQAILREFLDTVHIDGDDSDDDVSSVYSVCSNCKHPAKLNVVRTVI